ncbi:MAG: hypothetical protein QOH93_1350 [Chloroflexia bacterium]|jgi:hypothetical protein|nr:hypothetical protein [Chloroflexia bacterium]
MADQDTVQGDAQPQHRIDMLLGELFHVQLFASS